MTSPFQSLAAFEAAISFVSYEDAERLRSTFIQKRLDPQRATQAAVALRLSEFPDGLAYPGYLWDYLRDTDRVTEEYIWDVLGPLPSVYAMWDLHSSERVYIPDYFKFPRGTVLQAEPATLMRGVAYLPEDLYIFDGTCNWAAALTHEHDHKRRFCVWSGDLLS